MSTAIGITAVISFATAQQWTAILDPAITITGPILGTLVGCIAGLGPARRAEKISPIEAIRR